MRKRKSSFFEKLTGAVNEEEQFVDMDISDDHEPSHNDNEGWLEENEGDAELTVDVYQTSDDIVVQTIVAGVDPSELDVSITREMVTISGRRSYAEQVSRDDYFHQELYWGGFTRTIILPEEIDVEEAEATAKNGLMTIRMPKIDKKRKTKLEVQTD